MRRRTIDSGHRTGIGEVHGNPTREVACWSREDEVAERELDLEGSRDKNCKNPRKRNSQVHREVDTCGLVRWTRARWGVDVAEDDVKGGPTRGSRRGELTTTLGEPSASSPPDSSP